MFWEAYGENLANTLNVALFLLILVARVMGLILCAVLAFAPLLIALACEKWYLAVVTLIVWLPVFALALTLADLIW
jgi:hypothetical protein